MNIFQMRFDNIYIVYSVDFVWLKGRLVKNLYKWDGYDVKLFMLGRY